VYRFALFFLFPISFFLVCAGCQRGPVKVGAPETAVIPVSRPEVREVTDYVDFTGRTNALNPVTIISQVTGKLVDWENEETMPLIATNSVGLLASPLQQGPWLASSALFTGAFNKRPKEGGEVKKGDLLFRIDPRPYKAQMEGAKAQVQGAKAQVDQAQAKERYAVANNALFKEIAKKQPMAVSARELEQYQAQEDEAKANVEIAKANVEIAKANLETAKLNLEWTDIKSPIDGLISRYFLTSGNLVNQNVTQLTTVVSLDPIYVYFDMDEGTYLRIKRAISEGRITHPRQSADALVWVGLQGEESYPHQGFITFVDNQVNPSTGSILVRGEFKNPRLNAGSFLMVPGNFVRVHFPIGQPQKGLLVIDRAIASNQGLKSVYVLDADDKVKERRVTLGPLQEDGLRVITQGLNPDDWVVVGGLQQVQPGLPINPEKLERMPSLGNPATPIPTKKGGKQEGKKKGK
jgi:multidrug efflux system membrane fusion protein